MKLSSDQIRHIAKLARINLTEKEIDKFRNDLSDILDYVEALNEINTENVEVTAQVTGLKNIADEDKVDQIDYQKDLLKCSSLPKIRNQITVKKVI